MVDHSYHRLHDWSFDSKAFQHQHLDAILHSEQAQMGQLEEV